jgi:hypothetical protein
MDRLTHMASPASTAFLQGHTWAVTDYIPKIVAFAAPIAVVIMMLTGVVYAWRVRLEKIWISLWVIACSILATGLLFTAFRI